MSKLKLQTQITANGAMGGANGEMDWMVDPWSADMMAYSQEIHRSPDRIILGRPLAEGFIPAWESRRDDPQGEDAEAIEWMNNTPKIVFSRTITESPWKNATIVSGDVTEIVTRLKNDGGGDLITYGGGELISEMVAKELIDEVHLFVHPSVIGSGVPIFGSLQANAPLRLVSATAFECGVTALHYAPAA